MIPQINMKRSVDVSCWRAVGQIAKASRRAELIPILLRVHEQGQSNAEDIASHLLFEPRSRRVVAERLLKIAVTYQLLEENRGLYSLTDAGLEAIETKQVFVPELGTWTIWASNDPLLSFQILRIEAWQEPSAKTEIWDKDDDAKRDFSRLPEWLSGIKGLAQRPCVGDGHDFRIDVLETEGEKVPADAGLSIEWSVGASRLRIEGHMGGKHIHLNIDPPNRSHAEVWRELLQDEDLWTDWDNMREALLVEFEDTEDAERETMTRTLRFGQPRLEGFGTFDAIEVNGVGLAAQSQSDAERWARCRFDSRVLDYATQQRMEQWAHAAKEPFTGYRINLPSRGELAHEAWAARGERPSPHTWHLVAAEDWRL